MKKIISLLFILTFVLALVGCSNKKKLYVINVGDYINKELVSRFEEEYNCEVVYTETNSNEEIYQKLKNESYDICVVSDYMIERMYKEKLIQKIDYNKLDNYKAIKVNENEYQIDCLFDDKFNGGSSDALTFLNDTCGDSYLEYFIPYFWGTVGILYNTDSITDTSILEEKGLSLLFENNEYNKGMYNSSRDALCMSLIAYNIINETSIDINTSSYDELKLGCDLMKSVTYRAWGDDNLKAMVRSGMLDIAMVYSGDYMDELYQCEADGMSDDDINFSYYAPHDTNLWFDGMVLTSNSKNIDLAYKFLDFFQEPNNCAENADYIGYFPMNKDAFIVLCNEYEDYYTLDIDDDGYILFKEDEEEPFTIDDDLYIVYTENRKEYAYRFVSVDHYNWLNDLLDEAKSK